jgi:hypothetical protein
MIKLPGLARAHQSPVRIKAVRIRNGEIASVTA